MSAPTDFEKRLIELNLTYAQIELVKQEFAAQFDRERTGLKVAALDEFRSYFLLESTTDNPFEALGHYREIIELESPVEASR